MPKSTGKKSIEDTYKKMEPLEHVLALPDTYIGSVQRTSFNVWTWDVKAKKMVQRDINIVPGFYKIFDEVLVNAIDHFQRLKSQKSKNPVTFIKVTIDPKEGFITVHNNGEGIPVEIHNEHNIYVPELIFGHLLTSSNYDTKEDKLWGGKNGYGAKLAFAYSTQAEVETVDSNSHQKYRQVFRDNLSTIDKPKITSKAGNSYTKITYYPDFARFGMKRGIDPDTYSFMVRRVYDAAACTDNSVSLYLNGEKIEVKEFKKYVDLYIGNEQERPRVYEKVNPYWEVIATVSDDNKFEQVSFVNGIYTFKGGTHVNHVTDRIRDKVMNIMSKKHPQIKPAHIRDNLFIFVKSLLVNPSFGSQSKEDLTTAVRNFSTTCDISENFVKKLLKLGLQDEILRLTQFKVDKDLQKIGGKKERRVRGIAKLEDALWAGTDKGHLCSLFVTEGDSAKAAVISGTSHVDPERQRFGVFPIRGKLLNVRDAPPKQIAGNQEINDLMRIVGLQIGKKISDPSELRYGRIVVTTDADVDGSHIKGLIFNFIHHYWPELMKHEGFLQSFITPIVKVTKGSGKNQKSVSFYSQSEYEKWVKETDLSKWNKPKYYKGLGTSGATEFKEYFEQVDNNIIRYMWRDMKFNMREVGNISLRHKMLKDKFGMTFDASDFSDEEDMKLVSRLEKELLANDLDEASTENRSSTPKSKAIAKSTPKNSYSSSKSTDDNDEQESISGSMASTPSQSKFANLSDVTGNVCDTYLTMAFDKKCADYRKKWLQGYQRNRVIDYNVKTVSYDDFIDNDLIHFSDADNKRSIPSICDGLKPSQRKVIFGAFKRNLRNEIKVAQLAGYVSEHAAYHHGEQSLCGTIVNMAQNYVGSNNINSLRPSGQFGTRIQGGKDSASPRYIFTCLENVTYTVFHRDDEMLWNYLEDDGQSIEPDYYVPVVPLILVNGSEGIGTGYSSKVPQYNPTDITKNLRRMMNNEPPKDMTPWYRGFKGTIIPEEDGKYICRGRYNVVNATTLEITELPIGVWTQNYKDFLESITIGNHAEKNTISKTDAKTTRTTAKGKTAKDTKRDKPKIIKDYHNSSTDVSVHFTIQFPPGSLEKLMTDVDKFEKLFHLSKSINTSNMWLYNYQGRIQRYSSAQEILNYYFIIRSDYYQRRRDALLKYLKYEMDFIGAKLRFVIAVINKEIKVTNQKKTNIIQQLETFKPPFPKYPQSISRVKYFGKVGTDDIANAVTQSDDPTLDDDDNSSDKDSYDYLLSMPIYNLTYEKKKKLEEQLQDKDMEYKTLKKKTKYDLWTEDLDEFDTKYTAMMENYEKEMEFSMKHPTKSKKKGGHK